MRLGFFDLHSKKQIIGQPEKTQSQRLLQLKKRQYFIVFSLEQKNRRNAALLFRIQQCSKKQTGGQPGKTQSQRLIQLKNCQYFIVLILYKKIAVMRLCFSNV